MNRATLHASHSHSFCSTSPKPLEGSVTPDSSFADSSSFCSENENSI